MWIHDTAYSTLMDISLVNSVKHAYRYALNSVRALQRSIYLIHQSLKAGKRSQISALDFFYCIKSKFVNSFSEEDHAICECIIELRNHLDGFMNIDLFNCIESYQLLYSLCST